MWYIKSTPEYDNYGNPHFPAHDGDIELPAELLTAYINTKGFAILTVTDGVITAIEKNTEAYNAYEAEHPVMPDPPTDIDRLEAQVLYTAVMTDTLIEE